ncbi:MAG TPA: DUF3160 domain-containing protein [bacterium]|nr:DUF3160 domain-containing protein [bacterium]
MPHPIQRLKEWFGGLSPARKWIYPIVTVLLIGGITVGLVILLSVPAEAGRLVPEGVEIVEAKLPSPVQITTGEGNDSTPAVSPDGTLVAFASDRSGNSDLYVVPAAGGELHQLTHSTSDEKDPHYSPDGSSLVYVSRVEGDYDVWVMDARGGGELRLTHHEGDETEPRWSPIQFQSDTLHYRVLYGSAEGPFTVREDGSDRQPVALPVEGVSHLRWTPHGLGVLGEAETDEGVTVVATGLEGIFPVEGVHGRGPLLSPNMTGLLFIGSLNGNHRIYYYEPSRGRLLKLNPLSEPGRLAWAPDGSGFYYTDLVDGFSKIFYQPLPLPLSDVTNLWQYDLRPEQLDALERSSLIYGDRRWPLFDQPYLEESPGDVVFASSYTRPTYVTADALEELTDYYLDFLLLALEEDTARLELVNFYFALDARLKQEIHQLEEARSYALANPESLLVAQVGGVAAYDVLMDHLRFLASYVEVGGELLVPANVVRAGITNPDAFQAATAIRGGAGPAPVVSRGNDGYPAEFFQAPDWVRRTSEAAAGFYRGYNWASRVKFRLTDRDQTLEALILTYLLGSGELRSSWGRLDDAFAFQFGEADDFDVDTLDDLMRESYGADVTLAELADPEGLARFTEAVAGIQAKIAEDNPEEAEKEPTFALFAERTWPLEVYLATLRSPAVGTDETRRPSAGLLDIAAADGSEAAWKQLFDAQGEGGYAGFEEALNAVKGDLRRHDDGLFYGWMRALRPFLATPESPEGEEESGPAVGIAALRAAYAFCGGLLALTTEPMALESEPAVPPSIGTTGETPALPLPYVYVEPSPELFERLAGLVKSQHDLLRETGLFPEFAPLAGSEALAAVQAAELARQRENPTAEELLEEAPAAGEALVLSGIRVEDVYRRFYDLLTRLGTIARQQVSGVPLTPDDQYYLLRFGQLMRELTRDTFRQGSLGYLPGTACARVANFEADEGYLALGLGEAEELLRIVPRPGGGRLLVVGAAYGYYEMGRRTPMLLSDWLGQVAAEPPPIRPGWTASFAPEPGPRTSGTENVPNEPKG